MTKETVFTDLNVHCPFCKALVFDYESEDCLGESQPCQHLVAEIQPGDEMEEDAIEDDEDCFRDKVDWEDLEKKGVDHVIIVQQPPPSEEVLLILGFRCTGSGSL